MKEYKDLKIMEVLSGYFIFKELLDNNLITKQDSGYTINVNEANIYLEKQLLKLQQENTQLKNKLDLKEDDIRTLSKDIQNAKKIIDEYKSKLDKIENRCYSGQVVDAKSGEFYQGQHCIANDILNIIKED